MKILFVTPSYKPAYVYGGPTVSVSELAETLVKIGHSVTVYTTTANGRSELPVQTDQPVELNGVWVHYHERKTGDHTHISPALWKQLWHSAGDFDIIHLQSWWSILILGAAMICLLKKRTYVISPRGMLSEYTFLHQHNLFKKVLHRAIGKKLIRRGYLHATTAMEWEDCHKVYQSWQGFVQYNLINLPDPRQGNVIGANDKIQFGFLSRIDPKKGIELLFKALAKLDFDYHLQMAGSGQPGYVESLKSLANELGISDNICWVGWQSSDEKFNFLQNIDLFVLPSYNENFANSVIESLAVGCPVLVSNKVGLYEYIAQRQLGWICEPNVESLRAQLNSVHRNRHELNRIKQIAPQIVAEDFNKTALAERYSSDYFSILHKETA